MGSVFDWLRQVNPAGFLPEALIATLVGITLPLAFILARRAYRRRYFWERDRRTLALRSRWPAILDGRVPPETWRFHRLDREIVESMLLDRLEVAPVGEAEPLRACLRSSGLLDMRIWEARNLTGWRRRQALVSLGRMQATEAIPALSEALDDLHSEVRVAALRGLGRTGLPAAAEPILARVSHGPLLFPESPLQIALLSCCRPSPAVLVPYLHRADDDVRPVLARVLGEIATPALEEDLLQLASDPLPAVRASAARALGEAKPRLALTALASLAGDDVWYVRLRAVVAMGQLRDPRTIPELLGTLCDTNRHVRLRSAWALARLEDHVKSVLEQAVRLRDRYALQALVSELERSGRLLHLVAELDPRRGGTAARREASRPARAALLAAIRAGAHRLLLDAMLHHPSWRVRLAVARLLAESGQATLVAPLERLAVAAPSGRQRRIIRWTLHRLRDSQSSDTSGRTEASAPDRRDGKVPV